MNGLDLLIYNAGYGQSSERLDCELDKRTVDTNVNGFIEIVNFCFNYFLLQDEGQIANSKVKSQRSKKRPRVKTLRVPGVFDVR